MVLWFYGFMVLRFLGFSGSRIEDLGSRVKDTEFGVQGSGSGVQEFIM